MSMTVSEFKDNISAMLHGGTLNKVRNFSSAMERAASTMLLKIDPINTMRVQGLSETVHDDVFNYSLPSDFKKIIDLYPQSGRDLLDSAARNTAEPFDLKKDFYKKRVSIEGTNGSKIIRINWKKRQPKVVNELDSLTANGTWSAVATATDLKVDSINYVSGSGAISFDLAASGDGIQNTTMTALNLTDEDEVGAFFVRFYIKNSTDLGNLTSVSLLWGNDLTTNFWTGVAQTAQFDGTAFKVGWNEVKIPWSTATETGTVTPSSVDYVRFTVAASAAITGILVDNITVSIGTNFDVKYYSKFILKNTSGTWITKTTSDDDTIVLDNDAMQIYMLETLIACAHQIEGTDSGFDIAWAKQELNGNPGSPDPAERLGLLHKYRSEYPTMAKKAVANYMSSTSNRHFTRNRMR